MCGSIVLGLCIMLKKWLAGKNVSKMTYFDVKWDVTQSVGDRWLIDWCVAGDGGAEAGDTDGLLAGTVSKTAGL